MATPAPVSQALSPAQKGLLKLGLRRDMDLALHLPLRFEDETRITRLADARDGEVVQIEGTVTASEVVLRTRKQWLVTLDDGSDTCMLRFFTFFPSQQKAMPVGARIRARGELKGGYQGSFQGGFFGRTMMHPVCKLASGPLPTTLTPVYPTVAGLPQAYLRKAVQTALVRVDLSPTVPSHFVDENSAWGRWSIDTALSFLHRPQGDAAMAGPELRQPSMRGDNTSPADPQAALHDRSHPAWQRLKAEELLAQQISQLQARQARALLVAPRLRVREGRPTRGADVPAGVHADPSGEVSGDAATAAGRSVHAGLLGVIPFELTRAQARVCSEIAHDLALPQPMHRLLQGDVGSGKTVVAALAAAVCIDAGWQCALMAPTEILASQHFAKLVGWLAPLGVRVAWLTGGQKKKERAAVLAQIASGEAALVIGTHAVIQAHVQFKCLALAVIDEQHRFGVAQRLALRDKMTEPGQEPHLLMMSATPIPRTLAMSYYADLEVSTLDELPPGRTPIVTKLVADSRRAEVIERIRSQLTQGRQVYWVCPLIEESEALDLVNATESHAQLQEALAGHRVELLHSRMPVAEKRAVMAAFVAGAVGVLVSTTVIEVGVDVPNASLMVIDNAERFGLSQLHQLRGRVGRGAAASACVLLYGVGEGGRLGETARDRLRAMAETADGFEIARRDLEIRGPGEFLGARQSGAALLRFADLAHDGELLDWAREAAPRLLAQCPELAARHVERWLGSQTHYLKA